MFADGTNLFLSGINVDDLFSDMNCELNKISFWFKVNKLLLNLTKWIILPLKEKMLLNFKFYNLY